MIGNPATILFFGRPGAGKTTQAILAYNYLAANTSAQVGLIQWSDIRDAFTTSHPAAKSLLADAYAQGKLQPKFLSISMWGPYLLDTISPGMTVLIEGIPRQTFEAEALHSALEFLDRTNVQIINLDIDREVAVERLIARAKSEQRPDDISAEALHKRMDWFETDTLPAMQFLQEQGNYRIIRVDANRAQDVIQREIEGLLNA